MTPLVLFNENIQRIRSLHALYSHMHSQITDVFDISDLLRAEIVLLASAFDFYIHELVKEKMLESFSGRRPMTDQFRKFEINLDSVHSILNNGNQLEILKDQILVKHGYKSFQTAEKVAEAIRLISDIQLWNDVASIVGQNANDIKIQLNLIIDRRNKIAHEADIDPTLHGKRWPINEEITSNSVHFIEEISLAIDSLV